MWDRRPRRSFPTDDEYEPVSTLTVLTLVPNAGDRLTRCLESVAWADEIFCIVDPATTDGSDEVARRYTDRVVVHEYVNKAAQCNWALPQITSEWTLVLDADEWITDALAKRIRDIIAAPEGRGPAGYRIRRESLFFGRPIRGCGWQRDYNLRLFRTRSSRYQERRVHASVDVDGEIGRIDQPMMHDTYRNFDEYFATFHRFTSWGAQDLYDRGRRAGLFDLAVRPASRFIRMFLLQHGYRDGLHGAVLCGLGAFSVFMKYARLWDLQRRGEPPD